MAVERTPRLGSSHWAPCAHTGGLSSTGGLSRDAGPSLAGKGAESAGRNRGRKTVFKGLLWFDRHLRLTRIPGRKG